MSGNGNGDTTAAATITDDLIAKARAIASRSDELLHLLEDARQRLLNRGNEPTPSRRFPPDAAAKPDPQSQAPEPPEEEISDGLRVLITQMSMAGSSREEIAARLRDEFVVADPEAILRRMGL